MGFKPSQRDGKKSVPSLIRPPEPRETQSTALRPQTEAELAVSLAAMLLFDVPSSISPKWPVHLGVF